MTTIDLGDISSPDGEAPSHPLDRRLIRRVALFGTALLCLFMITASARPAAPHGLRPLWGVALANTDSALLGADAVYTYRSTGGTTRLTAYDLVTGAVRWERTFSVPVAFPQLAERAGLVLLAADPQTASRPPGGPEAPFPEFNRATIALDARTGEQRWTAPGAAAIVAADTVLLAGYTDYGYYARLTLARLSDRRTLWTRATPGQVYSMVSTAAGSDPERPDRIVTATLDGQIDVLRYADGGRVTGGRVPWIPPDSEHNQFNDVAIGGGYLTVNRSRNGRAELGVYRLDTLAELWRADNTESYAFGCGAMLCVSAHHNLTAYDAATGRELWQRPGPDNGWEVTPGRLVAENTQTGGDNAELDLIDAATGRPIGDHERGQVLWTLDPGDAVVVLRSANDPPGRTAVTRWDLATGRGRLLGSIEQLVGYRCQSRPGYLACQTDHEFQVTAIG